jgi:hypothetical protein
MKSHAADHLKRIRKGLQVEYSTALGASIVGRSEDLLCGAASQDLRGKVQLVFTSPPFPLNRKKKYGNLEGEEFKEWLRSYALPLRDTLTENGSIVLEMGNAWEPGAPVMSTLAIEALLDFKKEANLFLCQEFVWYNPAKLPTPAQWVTIERIRVKDSFTRLWWLSPTPKPKANNRNVLAPYSSSMKKLLKNGTYNAGRRPSQHLIGPTSFLSDNGGAIPPNVLVVRKEDDAQGEIPSNVLTGSNTGNGDAYDVYCRAHGVSRHPARMPREIPEFFVKLCTTEGDLVLDPFAGSNTTGAVAEELGRRWLAIEANRAYARPGAARFGLEPADSPV